jgi:hypothetical protein
LESSGGGFPEFAQCPPWVDEQTVQYYCRAWILHLFGSVLFPDGTGDTASWMWIHCLTDWDQTGHYSWGSAVLAFLYHQLCEACRRSSQLASLGGCVYLLSCGCGRSFQLLVPWCWLLATVPSAERTSTADMGVPVGPGDSSSCEDGAGVQRVHGRARQANGL